MTVTINGTTGVAGVDGTASTPAIQGNDTNTGIFFPAADTIAFAEGGAEVARFNSSGTLSTSFDASINGVSVGRGGGNVSTNTAIGASALNANTTGASNAAFAGAIRQNTTGSYNTGIGVSALDSNTTASDNTAVGFQAGYSTTTGGTNVFVGQTAGYNNTTGFTNTFIGFNSGSQVTTGAKNTIIGRYNGNSGNIDMRTLSNWIVLSDGDGNVRYTYNASSGMNLFGTSGRLSTDSSNANTFVMGIPSGWPGTVETTCGSYTTNYTHYNFRNGNGIVGEIRTNGSGTSFLTSSDYRLKENVTPMVGALDKVALLKPCTYTWKVDGSQGQGFIAHELQEVVPDCVSGEKDAVNEDGTIKAQGIDTSFLVATLTAAIQEQQAIITDLKARIETLENK